MTPESFISKWSASTLKERSAAQSHFNDLCELIGVEKPTDADTKGEWFCFERGASKTAGGEGWADVWKRGHFGWEYKGKRKNLRTAYAQLQQYAVALENPPLLVVCDMERIIVHTNWTNTVSEIHEITLDDLLDPYKREILKWVFTEPEQLKPQKTIDALTLDAANRFASLAIGLGERGHDPHIVAHFINRLVFCMFAEDINLLPRHLFSQILDRSLNRPELTGQLFSQLFASMKDGGLFGVDEIEWFNGGLFDDDTALELSRQELKIVAEAAALDWSDIDPSIFGTLFERGLDPTKRNQLGAHYTNREKIAQIVVPIVTDPLLREWANVYGLIKDEITKQERIEAEFETIHTEADALFRSDADSAKKTEKSRRERISRLRRKGTRAFNKAVSLRDDFLRKLRNFKILDPACGSGNFLYVALHVLKDIDHRVRLDCEAFGIPRGVPEVAPDAVRGIEINPYAAELARVTIWIGEIQWMRKNGFDVNRQPVLRPLDTIQNRDALLNQDNTEAEWPDADVIIGNPPFLGSRKLQPALGSEYVSKLRRIYGRSIPDGADFVCLWFKKANDSLDRTTSRVGLVATNSISGGQSREVLKAIGSKNHIFRVWSDEPWTVDGAAVRVAMVCFGRPGLEDCSYLDDQKVDEIYSDLTGRSGLEGADLTKAGKLPENANVAFQGVVPRSSINRKDAEKLQLPEASFLIHGDCARKMLEAEGNPNGHPNSDVIVPYLVGDEIVNRPLDRFIVDFHDLSEFDSSLYEKPFKHILPVKEHRAHMNQKQALELWWRHWNTRPKMRDALAGKNRYIATPRVSKHRIFRWVPRFILPDNMIVAIARDDDTTFGILHSRFHEQWSLRLCTYLGVGNDPRYTPSTTFETFPFPHGLGPNVASATFAADRRAQEIASLACKLNELRESWLNPKELVGEVICPKNGFPIGLHPVSETAKTELKKRKLTKLYNDRPSWLHQIHTALNAAVARAYGWPEDIDDDTAMQRLLEMNTSKKIG